MRYDGNTFERIDFASTGISSVISLFTDSRAVSGFVKDAEQFDDLTMLCLEYNGPSGTGSASDDDEGTDNEQNS